MGEKTHTRHADLQRIRAKLSKTKREPALDSEAHNGRTSELASAKLKYPGARADGDRDSTLGRLQRWQDFASKEVKRHLAGFAGNSRHRKPANQMLHV